MSIRIALLVALACAPALSSAKSTPESVPIDPHEFIAVREDIEQAIRKSQAFRELDPGERKEIARALDRMESTLSGLASVEDLDPTAKTQLVNDRELLDYALTKARADDKVICQRTRKIGSNMPTRTCLTVGERRRRQESVDQEFQRVQGQAPNGVQ